MIAQILTEDSTIFSLASQTLERQGIHCIHARDVIRLIDQIHEIRPDILIAREKDFPLHIGLIAALVHFSSNLQHSRFLVIGNTCPPWRPGAALSEERYRAEPRLILGLLNLERPSFYSPDRTMLQKPSGSLLVAKANRIAKRTADNKNS